MDQTAADFAAASSHPILTGLFFTAFACYGLAWLVTLAKPSWGRWPLAVGVVAHLSTTIGRGWAIAYFPLSNKMESFSAAALSMGIVALLSWRPNRVFTIPLLTFLIVAMRASWSFGLDLVFPNPMLITVWYPLHVPISFLCYALWAAGGAAGMAWFASRDPMWLRRVDRFSLWGFGLWSVSMIFGGIWGVVAWGAYFLWDPKVIWSVILWFHYASLIHVRLTPSMRRRHWVRPVLALVGVVWVFIAYVGTSFLFGGSSHAF